MFTTSHTHADYPECYLLPAAAPCCCCPRRSASFGVAVVGPQSPSAATAATTPCRCRRSSYCMQYTRIDPRACLETRRFMRATSHAPRVPASASDALASARPSSPCRRCRQRRLRLKLIIYAPLRATPLDALQSQPDAPQRVRRAQLESRKPLSLTATRPASASSHAECSAAAPYPARPAQLAKL